MRVGVRVRVLSKVNRSIRSFYPYIQCLPLPFFLVLSPLLPVLSLCITSPRLCLLFSLPFRRRHRSYRLRLIRLAQPSSLPAHVLDHLMALVARSKSKVGWRFERCSRGAWFRKVKLRGEGGGDCGSGRGRGLGVGMEEREGEGRRFGRW
jgi:hypothetical protein